MLLRPPTRSPLRLPTAPPIFDVATESLLDRMTTVPGAKRQNAIDTLIRSLKAAGSWAKMDALYVLAAHDSQAANRNWIADQYNLTVGGGSPTFVANSHYVGDGSTAWLDTGFNPTTASTPKLVQDSAHFGIWHLTDTDNGGALSYSFGNANNFLARTIGVTGGITYRVNRSSSNTHSATVVLPGYVTLNRTTSLLFDVYFAGVDVGGASAASAAQTNANYRILSVGAAAWGNNQIRFVHFGSQLTAAEALATYNALNTYAGSL